MQPFIRTKLIHHAIRTTKPSFSRHPPSPLTQHTSNMSTTNSNLFTVQPTAPLRLMGVQYTHMSLERVEASFTVSKNHLQPASLLHGGVNALIGEELASVAATLNAPKDCTIVGTRITLNHTGSAVEGDQVVVSVTPTHLGRQIQLWAIRVEKEGKDGGERKLLSTGDMQAFVKQPHNKSKL